MGPVPGVQRAVLVSIDPWTDDSCDNRPFNYAIRKVQAAALADPALSGWEFHVLDLRTKDADDFLARIEAIDPDLVGASTYVWSFPTFIELARRLKTSRPARTIVFGGPSARPEMFELAPFRQGAASVDALVVGEGEEAFRQILGLADRSRAALREVPGLAVSTGAGWFLTPERPLPALDTLASPYVMGLVGGDPSNTRATGHLETFRGCPLSCTFCQWGDLSGSANRVFSTEYLVRELRAFQDLYMRHVFIIDAALNLNQRAFRNLAAAEREVGFFRKGHLITEVYPSHVTDEHLEFIAAARDVTLGIGLQSLDKQVLDGVERPFDEARFRRVVKDLVAVAPRTTIELIVGLPGDSPSTFRETLDRVLELGCGVRVYRCLVLPNALMTRAPATFQMEYDPYTLKMYSCLGWSRDELEGMLRELADRVSATDRATRADNGDPDTFTFHVRGTTTGERAPEQEARDRPLRAPELVAAPPPLSAPVASANPSEKPLAPGIHKVMAAAVHQATAGAWKLKAASRDVERMLLRIERLNEGGLTVEIRPARGQQAFRVLDGVAFSYLDAGLELSDADLRCFEAAAILLRRVIAGVALRSTTPAGPRAVPVVAPRAVPVVAPRAAPVVAPRAASVGERPTMPTTTIRLVDNYMSDSVYLEGQDGPIKVEPHDRAWVNVPIPVCESEDAFSRNHLELRVLLKNETTWLWEAGGRVRFSRDQRWNPDAEPVPALSEAGGGRGIVVGAMGGFSFKRVNR